MELDDFICDMQCDELECESEDWIDWYDDDESEGLYDEQAA